MSDYDRIHGGFFLGQSYSLGRDLYSCYLQANRGEHKNEKRGVSSDRRSRKRILTSLTTDRRHDIKEKSYVNPVRHGKVENFKAEIKVVIHHKKFAIEIKLERGLTISEIQFMQSLIVGYIFATDPHLIGKKMPKVLFWQGIQNIAE